MEKKIRHIVGIDEAGRGPLAGPVSVGAVIVPIDFDWDCIPGVGDSKKVTPKNREAIFRRAHTLKTEQIINFEVTLIDASVINEKGISFAIKRGVEESLAVCGGDPCTTQVLLDGALRAPAVYTFQKTIIKGDQTERVIGLASILAKVTRDEYMYMLAQKFPQYHFEQHKGYGTALHQNMLREYGMSPEHRTLFCRGSLGRA